MKSFAAFAIYIILSVSSAQAGQLKGVWLNNEGVSALTQEKATEAYNNFAQSLAEIPFSAEAHFNLGSSYFANKEYDKAIQEFDQAARLAEESGNKEVEFIARFNAGVSASEAKKIDEALDFYQKALDVQPDSLETKTNIELLTRSQSGDGGGGENQQQQENQNGEGQQQQKQPKQVNPNQRERQQPKPFNSKEMSPQDVNRIVEELKRQEEQIRAKFQNEKMKSAPNEKDW